MSTSTPEAAAGPDAAVDFLVGAQQRWDHAARVAALLAVDPIGLGGCRLLGGASPARQRWLENHVAISTWHRGTISMTGTVDEAQLLGGVDVVESLSAGKPVWREGVATRAAGQILCVRCADQISERVAHELAASMDRDVGEAFSLLLLDESESEKTALEPLAERLAFAINLDGIPSVCLEDWSVDESNITQARRQLNAVTMSEDRQLVLARAAAAMGISTLRADLFAVRCAKALAALGGRQAVADEDVAEAATLVLAPRARALPAAEESLPVDEPSPNAPLEEDDGLSADSADAPSEPDDREDEATELSPEELQEIVTEALSAGLVSISMAPTASPRNRRQASAGRSGQTQPSRGEGRPIGSRPGDPRKGGKLDILATIRAAVPWQRLRPPPVTSSRVRIYPSDLRVKRFAARTGTTVIFAVDASGSSAAARLAEVKGAVETLLGECYARRDQVSLIAFRGSHAEEIFPPSRSLTRARRAMAGLPGGGGTPLASAMELTLQSAHLEIQNGRMPIIVFLSDGQGNIALDGRPGRGPASDDVERMAPRFREVGLDALFFDTSKRPQQRVRSLADDMGARYVAMPYAQGTLLTDTVREERAAMQAAHGR